MRMIAFCSIALALGGCATVTRGTTNKVEVKSDPPEAQAVTSIGNACPATPCTFEVSRKSEFTVTVSKEGYESASVPVSTRIAGSGAAGFAGNLLVGGVIGMGVDAATGATLEHYPNPVSVTLVPLMPPNKPNKPRKPEPVDRLKNPPTS